MYRLHEQFAFWGETVRMSNPAVQVRSRCNLPSIGNGEGSEVVIPIHLSNA